MFKPHRFNPLLKAFPNLAHKKQVSSKQVHGRTREELLKEVEVKKTTTIEGGRAHITRKVVEEEVKTKETPAGHGKVQKTTEVEAVEEVTQTTRPARRQDGETETVQTTEILSRVHATTEGVAAVEMTPPHPPREETPEYARAHNHLVKVLDEPCAMCGVRNSTLHDSKQNPFGATAIETHHYPIERSLLDACDPRKVGVVFPQVKDRASLETFVDSEQNLMVLCDIHHRHPLHGIHHLTPQDFFVQPFLLEGYQVASTQEDAAKVMAADEKLMEKAQKR